MSNSAVVTFRIYQGEFSFLGIENTLIESSDFGYFWDNFFKMGGYDKIDPYAVDSSAINIWYTNKAGEKIYFQGLMVDGVDKVPEGYSLVNFPSSEYLVVTTEWLSTSDEALRHINHDYYRNAQMPDGYVKCGETDCPITLIEKEAFDTEDGSRYEFWVPIKKAD